MNYWILLLIVLLFICFFIIRNLLIKNEKSEDIILNQSLYIRKISDLITQCDSKIKEVDSKGSFESDDEVGIFFSTLKEIQEILNFFKLK